MPKNPAKKPIFFQKFTLFLFGLTIFLKFSSGTNPFDQ
jgi:hypothetical protein